jgi:hypothetical protein
MHIGSSIVGISMADGRISALYFDEFSIEPRWIELARDLVALLPADRVERVKVVRKMTGLCPEAAKDLCDLFNPGNEARVAEELGRNGTWRLDRCAHCFHSRWLRESNPAECYASKART